MMRKRPLLLLGMLAGTLSIPAIARAEQPGPHRHDPAKHPHVDLDEHVPIEGGKTATRRHILSHIDPNLKVDLHNGQKVTVGEFFGHLRDIEDRHGQHLSTIAAQVHVHPHTVQALEKQRQAHTEHVAQLRRAEQTRWADTVQRRSASIVGASQHVAPKQSLTAGWQKQFGHQDTLAAYGSFSVAVEAPNDHTAVCLASLDFGGYLLKHHQSLARVAFHEEAIAGSATGNVAVYVLGNATAVWKRDFKVGKEQGPRWTHTWATPEVKYDIGPFWGVITFDIKAKASATFELSAANELDPTHESAGCTADVHPSGNAKAVVDVGVKVGVPKLQHLVRVGVKGDVTIAKVTTPASAGMRVDQKPQVSMNERVKASVNASFLGGDLMFEVDLANPCIHIPLLGKHCLLSLFHVKSHYEFTFHKWAGFTYDHVLLDATRTQAAAIAAPVPSTSGAAKPTAPPVEPGGTCKHDLSKPFNIKACDDYVVEANRCVGKAGSTGAQLRAETNAQRGGFESTMCQEGGAAKLPEMCEEALRFLKRSCP